MHTGIVSNFVFLCLGGLVEHTDHGRDRPLVLRRRMHWQGQPGRLQSLKILAQLRHDLCR